MHSPTDWNPPDWHRFVWDEAALLDARGFVAWVGLFTADGRYWMPTHAQAAEGEPALALFDETPEVLLLRAERLLHPMTHVQTPPSRTHHHVSAVRAIGVAQVNALEGDFQTLWRALQSVQDLGAEVALHPSALFHDPLHRADHHLVRAAVLQAHCAHMVVGARGRGLHMGHGVQQALGAQQQHLGGFIKQGQGRFALQSLRVGGHPVAPIGGE